jgi:hypothetical protein
LLEKISSLFKKTNEFVFVIILLILICLQVVLRKFIFTKNGSDGILIYYDLLFNILLSTCLWAYYVKKYSPDLLRKSIMGAFLAELVLGIFFKKMHSPYSAEIMFIGLLGVFVTWIYTHLNRNKSQSN